MLKTKPSFINRNILYIIPFLIFISFTGLLNAQVNNSFIKSKPVLSKYILIDNAPVDTLRKIKHFNNLTKTGAVLLTQSLIFTATATIFYYDYENGRSTLSGSGVELLFTKTLYGIACAEFIAGSFLILTGKLSVKSYKKRMNLGVSSNSIGLKYHF